MSPTVSVILPAFNRPDTLVTAIQSVLEQSYKDLELIVVDDASVKDISGAVESFDDPRLVYLRRTKNGGAAAARNTGLAHARGRLIAFQDSDDMWLPGKLERQVALLESQPPEVGAVTGSKILYGKNNKNQYGEGLVAYRPDPGKWLTLEEDQVRRSLVENRISLQNAIFRREVMPEDPCFDPVARANVDWGFTVRLVRRTKILEETTPAVYSNISSDSVSLNTRQRLIATIRILRHNRSIYASYPNEHGQVLFMAGSLMWELGRTRNAWKTYVKSVQLRPRNIFRLSGKMLKVSVKRIMRLVSGPKRD